MSCRFWNGKLFQGIAETNTIEVKMENISEAGNQEQDRESPGKLV